MGKELHRDVQHDQALNTRECVSKWGTPKNILEMANLHSTQLRKPMDSRNILTSQKVEHPNMASPAPATTWMLVEDAAKSQVPVPGPSLWICPQSRWIQWFHVESNGFKPSEPSPKTNGWRAPKWWALEKVDSLKIWPFLVSMLDFWGVVVWDFDFNHPKWQRLKCPQILPERLKKNIPHYPARKTQRERSFSWLKELQHLDDKDRWLSFIIQYYHRPDICTLRCSPATVPQ